MLRSYQSILLMIDWRSCAISFICDFDSTVHHFNWFNVKNVHEDLKLIFLDIPKTSYFPGKL